MIKKPLVFSFVSEQRRFLFLLIAFLTFLMVISGGIVLSIGNSISRFNLNINKTALIQIPNGTNPELALKIINQNKNEILKIKTIEKAESQKLLNVWLKNTDSIASYIPTIIRIEAKSKAGLDKIAKNLENSNIRFIYSKNATPERSLGFKIILISIFIFITVFTALVACIVHSVKNIILIHKREIEILNQIGSTNNYIANQLQTAMFVQTARGSTLGLVIGIITLFLINGLSSLTKVGLLANMGLTFHDWIILGLIAILLVILSIFITKKTTLNILEN